MKLPRRLPLRLRLGRILTSFGITRLTKPCPLDRPYAPLDLNSYFMQRGPVRRPALPQRGHAYYNLILDPLLAVDSNLFYDCVISRPSPCVCVCAAVKIIIYGSASLCLYLCFYFPFLFFRVNETLNLGRVLSLVYRLNSASLALA